MVTKITNVRLVTETGLLEDTALYYENGVITAITQEPLPFDRELDGAGGYLCPGFIDLHLHGGDDGDFCDGTEEAVIRAANFHCRHGSTTLFPTTLSAPHETTLAALAAIEKVMEGKKALPNIPGVHIEGPYFSKKQCGAQNTDFITPPIPADYQQILSRYGKIVKRWSFAPELPGTGEFLDTLHAAGVVSSMGHTDARYEDVMAAYDKGCRLITHFYSCMSTITREKGFRVMGVLECGYALRDMMVEAIADGCHVPEPLFRMLYQIKGSDHICLVTDSMRCAGTDQTTAVLGGVPCKIMKGVAYLMDESAFAGSIATTDRLVRFCVQDVGIPLWEAVKMVTKNPALATGLDKKGRLEVGCDADLVLLDSALQVQKVLVMGEVI